MPDPDLDLRLVRYFTVVAQHGNFHRAAEALHLAQPSLSRQIQRLEQLVGVQLLDRTNQGCRPTEAGAVFLPRAQAMLAAAREAVAGARAAARPQDLTLGYSGNLHVTGAVRQLRERYPGAQVAALYLEYPDIRPALRDSRVDAVLAREPFPAEGLARTLLYEEGRALMVPVTHRLAGRASVTLQDFAAEPLVAYPDPVYDAFWRLDPRPDGSRAPHGPLVSTVPDKLELIASGQALALGPDCGEHRILRADVVTIPVAGIPAARVVLATRAGDDRPVLAELARLLGQKHPLPPRPVGGVADFGQPVAVPQ